MTVTEQMEAVRNIKEAVYRGADMDEAWPALTELVRVATFFDEHDEHCPFPACDYCRLHAALSAVGAALPPVPSEDET